MSGGGFAKLFSSIVTSSIWGEPDFVRIVWISLLALSDRNGEVAASVPGLARIANVPRDHCEEALRVLSSPDPDDRSGVAKGRRIESISGGWRIVNYVAYRERGRNEERRDYFREAKRKERHRMSTMSTEVNAIPPTVEAKVEVEVEGEKKVQSLALPAALETDDFRAAWTEWLAYRREAKFRPWRERTIRAKLGELAEIGSERAIAAIRKSIANGWSGIFPDSPSRGGRRSPASVPIAGHYSAEDIAAFEKRIRRHDATR